MPSDFDLLRPLDDEPRTPSTVDIRRAISDGRRRRQTRRIGYAGAATMTAVAVAGASVAAGGLFTDAPPKVAATGSPGATASKAPAAPKAPTSCEIERLPVPDNEPMALVSGADPKGQYFVGRSYPTGGGYQAVIWHDGEATKVMLPGDQEESLRDVNSAGTAVGWSYAGSGEDTGPVPYVYAGGKVSKLPGAERGEALAINDAGAIVGADDSPGNGTLFWSSATAKPVKLPLPAGASGATASDIDEDGTVVGNIGRERAYVWFADGTHRDLPMPSLDGKPATGARASSIHNGWVTGVADFGAAGGSNPKSKARADAAGGKGDGGESWAVRWNLRTGETRLFKDLGAMGNGVNAQGWQIGISTKGRAVFLTDTATVVLPALFNHEPGNLTNIPNTVSDDGRTIGGQSDDKSDVIQAVVWHCR